MPRLTDDNSYETPPGSSTRLGRALPSLVFHFKMLGIYYRAWRKAVAGVYDDEAWSGSSLEVVRALESVGVSFHLEGLGVLRELDTPCVFVANHMSTLETFVFPCVIHLHQRMVFVLKDTLLKFPVFRHIAGARDPISVGRTDPREDLKRVMEQGVERLSRGKSVMVFPQTTRSLTFDETRFNSIGVKLARRAGVPVVPIALKTDAWGVGWPVKDFGPVRPSLPVRMAFGGPMAVTGNGREQHEAAVVFIRSQMEKWGGNNK
jgi:1-acyl-sn-glycerol-3-phosphate acyltransferase